MRLRSPGQRNGFLREGGHSALDGYRAIACGLRQRTVHWAGGNNVVQREQIAVAAAAQLGVTPIIVSSSSADDLAGLFCRLVSERAEAVAVVDLPTFDDARRTLTASWGISHVDISAQCVDRCRPPLSR